MLVVPSGSVSTVRAYDAGIRDMASQWRPANILVKAPYEPSGNFFSITNYIKRVVIDPLTGRARVEGGEI